MKFDPVRLLQYRAACRRREARLHEAFLRRQHRRKAEEERRRMEVSRAECERRFPERLAAQEHIDGLIPVMLTDSDGIRRATLLTPDMDPPPSPIIFGNGYFHDGWARKHEVERTGPLAYKVTVLRAKPCCGDCVWVEESVWRCRREGNPRTLPA